MKKRQKEEKEDSVSKINKQNSNEVEDFIKSSSTKNQQKQSLKFILQPSMRFTARTNLERVINSIEFNTAKWISKSALKEQIKILGLIPQYADKKDDFKKINTPRYKKLNNLKFKAEKSKNVISDRSKVSFILSKKGGKNKDIVEKAYKEENDDKDKNKTNSNDFTHTQLKQIELKKKKDREHFYFQKNIIDINHIKTSSHMKNILNLSYNKKLRFKALSHLVGNYNLNGSETNINLDDSENSDNNDLHKMKQTNSIKTNENDTIKEVPTDDCEEKVRGSDFLKLNRSLYKFELINDRKHRIKYDSGFNPFIHSTNKNNSITFHDNFVDLKNKFFLNDTLNIAKSSSVYNNINETKIDNPNENLINPKNILFECNYYHKKHKANNNQLIAGNGMLSCTNGLTINEFAKLYNYAKLNKK